MNLPSDLVSEFVEITNDKTEVKTETTVYGTIVEYEGSNYVKLDGSDLLTPISSTAAVENGERVTVLIKNHTALVTGNISSPSVRTATVNEIEGRVTATETLIADKVSTKELEAEIARINTLTADNVTIKERLTASEANISDLQADNVTINGTLTAHTANIETLNTTKLSATDADLKYATIENLNATNANVHNLEADYGEFVELTTNNFTAANASISELQTKKLDAETANATYATIENLNATNADIDTLEGDFGSFKTLTTNNFVAANASIDDLKANKLSVTDASIKYANIDFSNIGKAAFEYFYANSGLINNVVVENGTITGNLVGVTISGDLIEGNTIKAEKLVIKGSDGLYYKLNTDGITTEAEQTDENSLNGSIIKANSITATKINVSDLVAFDATIGGFNISENSIYSGVKTTVDNTTSGIYMDKNGQMAFGDANNYVKFYKDTDGTYKLRIAADEIKFGSGNKTIAEALNDIIYKGDIPPSGTPETGKLWLDTGVTPTTLRRWLGADVDNVRSFEVEKSGSIVTFDDSTGYPSGELNITTVLEPVQSGSGTPYPAGCGKNLLPDCGNNSATNNGITLTCKGGVYKIEGTATANTTVTLPLTERMTVPTGTYIHLGNPVADASIVLTLRHTSGTVTNILFSTVNRIASTSDFVGKTIQAISVQVGSGKTVNFTFAPMITLDSTATSYEPYKNIRPISGFDSAKLTRCGKNLLPDIIISSGNFNSSGNGVFTYLSNNNTTISTFSFKAGVSYTISATTVNGTGYKPCIIVRNPTGDKTGQKTNYGETSNPLTFSFDTDTNWNIILQAEIGNGLITTVNDSWAIQLEVGTAATAYEPYQGNTYTADFGQTVYGGTLDWNTGVLTVDRALYTFDGSEWFIDPDWPNLYAYVSWNFLPDVVNYGWNDIADAYCSHYIADSIGYVYSTNEIARFAIYDTGHMIFSSPTHADVDAFKSYLAAQYTAGTPVQVCYKLAEPQTIQLTPNQIIALSGHNNIYSDNASVIVKATASGWEIVSDYSSITSIMQNQLDGVEETANSANDTANEANITAKTNVTSINNARLDINSLKSIISTLVTGQNGESLMTQTETGWTFSMASVLNTLNTATQSVSSLGTGLATANSNISNLQSSVNSLGVYTDYIKFETDNGKPCIVLGETDSNFKVKITNTDIRFIEGSVIPAYINNQSLNIGDAVIDGELRQGGFAWDARSNGNYGLVWKG